MVSLDSLTTSQNLPLLVWFLGVPLLGIGFAAQRFRAAQSSRAWLVAASLWVAMSAFFVLLTVGFLLELVGAFGARPDVAAIAAAIALLSIPFWLALAWLVLCVLGQRRARVHDRLKLP